MNWLKRQPNIIKSVMLIVSFIIIHAITKSWSYAALFILCETALLLWIQGGFIE